MTQKPDFIWLSCDLLADPKQSALLASIQQKWDSSRANWNTAFSFVNEKLDKEVYATTPEEQKFITLLYNDTYVVAICQGTINLASNSTANYQVALEWIQVSEKFQRQDFCTLITQKTLEYVAANFKDQVRVVTLEIASREAVGACKCYIRAGKNARLPEPHGASPVFRVVRALQDPQEANENDCDATNYFLIPHRLYFKSVDTSAMQQQKHLGLAFQWYDAAQTSTVPQDILDRIDRINRDFSREEVQRVTFDDNVFLDLAPSDTPAQKMQRLRQFLTDNPQTGFFQNKSDNELKQILDQRSCRISRESHLKFATSDDVAYTLRADQKQLDGTTWMDFVSLLTTKAATDQYVVAICTGRVQMTAEETKRVQTSKAESKQHRHGQDTESEDEDDQTRYKQGQAEIVDVWVHPRYQKQRVCQALMQNTFSQLHDRPDVKQIYTLLENGCKEAEGIPMCICLSKAAKEWSEKSWFLTVCKPPRRGERLRNFDFFGGETDELWFIRNNLVELDRDRVTTKGVDISSDFEVKKDDLFYLSAPATKEEDVEMKTGSADPLAGPFEFAWFDASMGKRPPQWILDKQKATDRLILPVTTSSYINQEGRVVQLGSTTPEHQVSEIMRRITSRTDNPEDTQLLAESLQKTVKTETSRRQFSHNYDMAAGALRFFKYDDDNANYRWVEAAAVLHNKEHVAANVHVYVRLPIEKVRAAQTKLTKEAAEAETERKERKSDVQRSDSPVFDKVEEDEVDSDSERTETDDEKDGRKERDAQQAEAAQMHMPFVYVEEDPIENTATQAYLSYVNVHPHFQSRGLCQPMVRGVLHELGTRFATDVRVASLSVRSNTGDGIAACRCYVKAAKSLTEAKTSQRMFFVSRFDNDRQEVREDEVCHPRNTTQQALPGSLYFHSRHHLLQQEAERQARQWSIYEDAATRAKRSGLTLTWVDAKTSTQNRLLWRQRELDNDAPRIEMYEARLMDTEPDIRTFVAFLTQTDGKGEIVEIVAKCRGIAHGLAPSARADIESLFVNTKYRTRGYCSILTQFVLERLHQSGNSIHLDISPPREDEAESFDVKEWACRCFVRAGQRAQFLVYNDKERDFHPLTWSDQSMPPKEENVCFDDMTERMGLTFVFNGAKPQEGKEEGKGETKDVVMIDVGERKSKPEFKLLTWPDWSKAIAEPDVGTRHALAYTNHSAEPYYVPGITHYMAEEHMRSTFRGRTQYLLTNYEPDTELEGSPHPSFNEQPFRRFIFKVFWNEWSEWTLKSRLVLRHPSGRFSVMLREIEASHLQANETAATMFDSVAELVAHEERVNISSVHATPNAAQLDWARNTRSTLPLSRKWIQGHRIFAHSIRDTWEANPRAPFLLQTAFSYASALTEASTLRHFAPMFSSYDYVLFVAPRKAFIRYSSDADCWFAWFRDTATGQYDLRTWSPYASIWALIGRAPDDVWHDVDYMKAVEIKEQPDNWQLSLASAIAGASRSPPQKAPAPTEFVFQRTPDTNKLIAYTSMPRHTEGRMVPRHDKYVQVAVEIQQDPNTSGRFVAVAWPTPSTTTSAPARPENETLHLFETMFTQMNTLPAHAPHPRSYSSIAELLRWYFYSHAEHFWAQSNWFLKRNEKTVLEDWQNAVDANITEADVETHNSPVVLIGQDPATRRSIVAIMHVWVRTRNIQLPDPKVPAANETEADVAGALAIKQAQQPQAPAKMRTVTWMMMRPSDNRPFSIAREGQQLFFPFVTTLSELRSAVFYTAAARWNVSEKL